MSKFISGKFGLIVSRDEMKDFSKLSSKELENHMRRSGAVFVTGFDLSLDQFIKYSNTFDDEYMEYIGGGTRRETHDNNKTVLTATGGEDPGANVELHGEQYYQADKPDKLFFFCAKTALTGGETTVCDGVEFFKRLPKDLQSLFQKNRVKYGYTTKNGEWQKIYNCETEAELIKLFETTKKKERDCFNFHFDKKTGTATTEYLASAVVKPYFTDELSFINSILSIRLMPRYIPGPEKSSYATVSFENGSELKESVVKQLHEISLPITFGLPWKTGDFVLVDNSRVMHGRWPYTGFDRKVIVRMSKYKSAIGRKSAA